MYTSGPIIGGLIGAGITGTVIAVTFIIATIIISHWYTLSIKRKEKHNSNNNPGW